MRCPRCAHLEDRVIDSRLVRDGRVIRRRRQCVDCGFRFTTYEESEESTPMLVKRDGRRERYDRQKLLSGIVKACQKRPVAMAAIDEFVDRLEADLFGGGLSEVPSSEVGEGVSGFLKETDPIAYIRFASVYRRFSDLHQFLDEIRDFHDQDPEE